MRWIKFWIGLSIAVLVLSLVWVYQELGDLTQILTIDETQLNVSEISEKPVIRIGVISRYAPSRIYRHYQPLIDYLNRECDCRVELKLSKNYEETVQQLAQGEVLAAFLGSYIYAKARIKYDLKPLVVPLNREKKPLSRAALVVRRGSQIHSVSELRGYSLALPSRSSFSANWLRERELKANGLHLEDLKEIGYFDYHHTVVFQVLWGKFDAGVVRESIAEEYRKEGIEIVAYSRPFPAPPLVCRKNADPKWTSILQKALLRLDPELNPLGGPSPFYGFAISDDEAYEEMSRFFFMREEP